MKLYAVSAYCMRRLSGGVVETNVRAGSCLAATRQEALDVMLAQCVRDNPASDGWQKHDSTASLVSDDMIRRAFAALEPT